MMEEKRFSKNILINFFHFFSIFTIIIYLGGTDDYFLNLEKASFIGLLAGVIGVILMNLVERFENNQGRRFALENTEMLKRLSNKNNCDETTNDILINIKIYSDNIVYNYENFLEIEYNKGTKKAMAKYISNYLKKHGDASVYNKYIENLIYLVEIKNNLALDNKAIKSGKVIREYQLIKKNAIKLKNTFDVNIEDKVFLDKVLKESGFVLNEYEQLSKDSQKLSEEELLLYLDEKKKEVFEIENSFENKKRNEFTKQINLIEKRY